MTAPAGIYVITAVMCNSRPYTVSADAFIIVNLKVAARLGVKASKHTFNRFCHNKISPASFASPNRVLVPEIIGSITVFSNPFGSWRGVFLLNKTVLLKPLAKHCRVIVLICNIGRAPVGCRIAGGVGILLVGYLVETKLKLIGGVGFV